MGLVEEVESAIEERNSSVEEGKSKVDAIKARIKAGESTGDKIKDYLIMIDGFKYKKLETGLRTLSENITKHQGELCMVVEQNTKEEQTVGHGFYDDNRYSLMICVLDGELDFDLENSDVVFPTEKYVIRGRTYSVSERPDCFLFTGNQQWTLKEKPLTFNEMFATAFDKSVRQSIDRISHSRGPKYKIVFGEKVDRFFRTLPSRSWQVLELDGDDKDQAEAILEHFKVLDLTYIDACKLLGVRPNPDYQKEHDEKILRKKLHILSSLEKLTEQASLLQQKIDSIYPGVNDFIQDKADAFFANYGRIEKKQEKRRQILSNLANAVELGMHESEMEIPLKPGITMNVPVYITELCKAYEVEIR